MQKTVISLLLAFMLAISFCACDEGDSSGSNGTIESTNYIISNEVLIDKPSCKLTITAAENDSVWGFTLKALCENNTDKVLMFSIVDGAVNGYALDPFWAKEVDAGKKANSDISFSKSDLSERGIRTIDEVKIVVRVYDSNDWSAADYARETFTLYPTGLSADEVVYPDRRITENEMVCSDTDACTFVILDTKDDAMWGYTLNCFMENKTDRNLMFTVDNVSVNDFMIDPFWAKEVMAGLKDYSGISFSKTSFDENGITNVDKIEFMLRVYDSDDWSAKDFVKQTITWKP